MSFIRAKQIPPRTGNWYDYEVRTVHIGGKVRQQIIRYVGKHGTGDRTLTDAGVFHNRPPTGDNLTAIASSKPVTPKVSCKHCNGTHTRKYGLYKGIQNYYCDDCNRKFIGTDAVPHGRVSPAYIASALDEFYGGMSFHEIEYNIENQTDNDISHTAVTKWIDKYTDKAIRATKDLHPKVGDVWIADETYLKTDIKTSDPKGVVFWDIIDAKTRFILATRVTTTRSTQDAKKLMLLASKRAGKTPKVVITDGLRAYIDGIEQAYGADTKHKQGSPFKVENNTSLIERFHNTLKSRTKVTRDLKDTETLKRFTDGWLVYYNFFRPDMALDNKRPAEVAGLDYPYHSWADVVDYKKSPIVQTLPTITESA
jgi:putative transposase